MFVFKFSLKKENEELFKI